MVKFLLSSSIWSYKGLTDVCEPTLGDVTNDKRITNVNSDATCKSQDVDVSSFFFQIKQAVDSHVILSAFPKCLPLGLTAR